MKNRKKIFATLIGVAITSQMLPSTYTILANAQTINDVKEESQDIVNDQTINDVEEESQDLTNNSNQLKNGLSNNRIRLYGVGCEETSDGKGHPGYHEFQISFENNKLKTTIKSGYPDDENHPFHPSFQNEYIKVTLLDKDGNIKKELSIKGTDNVSKAQKLNEWDFVYGDRLRIKHEEADWRTKIEGKVTNPEGQVVTGLDRSVSKVDLNNYDFEITKSGLKKVKAFTNELDKTKITLAGVGCQEGTHSFEVTLDPKTKKFRVDNLVGVGYTGTHPFHPYFEGEYIKISLIGKDGNLKYQSSITGTENVTKITEELSKWSFDYGDLIEISHAEADWRTKIDGNVTKKGKTVTGLNERTSTETLNNYDFKITKSGLEEVEKNIVDVSNSSSLIEQLKDKKAKTIRLTNNITFTSNDLSKFEAGLNGSKELIIGKGISIEGNNHTIDFANLGSLTLKGDGIKLSHLTIKNCANIGMQVYNSRNVYLDNITVEGCKRYGLFVNASKVKLENCTIKNNIEGGILISRSMALQDDKYTDSEVKVIGRLNQDDQSGIQVLIKDLEMLDGRMQENTFIQSANQHYKISKNEDSVTLSQVYCDILKISPDQKFREIIYKYNEERL